MLNAAALLVLLEIDVKQVCVTVFKVLKQCLCLLHVVFEMSYYQFYADSHILISELVKTINII